MYSPINRKIQKVWPCERVIESVSQTEARSCRVAVVLDTLSAPCCFVRDAFYDTLIKRNGGFRCPVNARPAHR
ncbi:hypothetical protein BRC69_04925 [Halobacteriales archaeon QH_6_66_25]|nr:MAG: hypothetical protein BRC69_04925 [Halobacteriales archaeon QH_6_66_25]